MNALRAGALPTALHALGRCSGRRDDDCATALAAADHLLADLTSLGLLCTMPAHGAGRA